MGAAPAAIAPLPPRASPPGLPPGPETGRLLGAVAFHRDPLRVLAEAQRRFGDLFTLDLGSAGRVVVAADPRLVGQLGGAGCAGEARRRVLPMASPRSAFGGDGDAHARARKHAAEALAPERVRPRAGAIAEIAERHIAAWPRGRPFRLLPRMRALADEVFVREVLEVRDAATVRRLAGAIGGLMWTPGNPPLSVPGPDDGLVGAFVAALYRRRSKRVALPLQTARPEADAEELLALLMAAQEPIAAALTWTALRIHREPGVAGRLREEGLDGPYARGVIAECLRLNPPAVGVLRRFHEPVELAGRILPTPVSTMLPIPLLQRDPRSFSEPDRFMPERHAAGEAAGLLPFGVDGRRCAGEPLARAELSAVIGRLLEGIELRALLPQPERMVLRATILVPLRSGLVRALPSRTRRSAGTA
jgi:cytochrome P450